MSAQQDDTTSMLPPGDELLAGEYVLGVLDADTRRQVEQRIHGDARFARQVVAWEARLAPLLSEAAAMEPSAHVWPRIRTSLGWPSVQVARSGIWNNAGFWRGATALAIAAGVAAVVIGLRAPTPIAAPGVPVVVQVPKTEEQAAKPVVVLTRDNGTTGWLATVDPSRTSILMVPVPTPLDASGRVDELWIIPPGEAPQSLGFVSNEKAHTIKIPPASRRALEAGATLAVTLEPKVGIPHAAPSGPVVAKCDIASI
jgi:anti-sigma-K factor RskA